MKIWKVTEVIGIDMLSKTLNDIENMNGKVFQIVFVEKREGYEIYRVIWTID